VRASVLTTAEEAVAGVRPGATIGIGGVINSGHPMAIVREIVRQGIGDLHVVGLASGLEVDMLITAGLVRRLSTPTVSAETLQPIAPAYRRAAEAGEIEIWECDEGMVYAALQAAAQRVPFAPWPAGMGASFAQINDGMEEIAAPFGGRRVLALRAIELDVAFAHAARADVYGNVQVDGSGFGDRALAQAARRVVYTVDRIIPNHEVRRRPETTVIAGVDAVVHAPFGAHPFAAPGLHIHDEDHLRRYLSDPAGYVAEWVAGPASHWDYVRRVGAEALHGLEEGLHAGS